MSSDNSATSTSIGAVMAATAGGARSLSRQKRTVTVRFNTAGLDRSPASEVDHQLSSGTRQPYSSSQTNASQW
jgi:hypothetical protein